MSGERLHYEVHDGTGRHLLMLHGLLSSRAQWLPNLASLAGVCRPVVAELWGHGRSPSPADPKRYHPEAYGQAFEQIRQDLGLEQWLICGQSFAAGLMLRYALDYPERVGGTVFTNSTSGLADAATAAGIRTLIDGWAEAIDEQGKAAIETIPIHPLYAKRVPPEIKAALIEDAKLLYPLGLIHTFRETSPIVSVRGRLGENTVPTLLVCGQAEHRFGPSRAHAESHMPLLEVVVVSGAGHAVNIEAPDRFNAALADFLAKRAV